jgi:hypothetical protein
VQQIKGDLIKITRATERFGGPISLPWRHADL